MVVRTPRVLVFWVVIFRWGKMLAVDAEFHGENFH